MAKDKRIRKYSEQVGNVSKELYLQVMERSLIDDLEIRTLLHENLAERVDDKDVIFKDIE